MAVQAAKLDERVAVVERRRSIGGVWIETGTIPSKTFRETVRRFYSRPGLESDRGGAVVDMSFNYAATWDLLPRRVDGRSPGYTDIAPALRPPRLKQLVLAGQQLRQLCELLDAG